MKNIFELAVAAADEAVFNTQEDLYCGFAWVVIRPARGEFVSWCKKNKIGDKGVYGGWSISSYHFCHYNGQSMTVKEAAARAFAGALSGYGINVSVNSRAD